MNGVGLSASRHTCALAIYACISFYALSKVFIYAFLVEKVYIVWSAGKQVPRFTSPAYRISAFVMLGYVVVLVLMIMGENSTIRPDGLCVIGLKNYATIPLISYDLFLNVFLTAMFVWPLWRSNIVNLRLKKVAIRTLYGAIVSLTTSAVNVAVLTALKGEEYGWVCLGSCVTDVALNAMALTWVTAKSSNSIQTATVDQIPLPTMDTAQSDCKQMVHDDRDCVAPLSPKQPPPQMESDFIPRNSRYSEVDTVTSRTDINKGGLWGFKEKWRPVHDVKSLSGVRITVTQSTSVSAAEEGRPSSRDLESQMYSQRSSSLERL